MDAPDDVEAASLQRRLDRERRARRAAETIAEDSLRQVYDTVRELQQSRAVLDETPDFVTRQRRWARSSSARAWTKQTFASDGMTVSRRALGQSVEVVTLVQTPQGPVCAVYLEGKDPFEANRRHSASSEPVDVAFREELTHLFPPFVDFTQPVPGITEIFDSRAVLARR